MKITEELIARYPALDVCKNDITKTIDTIIECYKNGGKLMLCGNGGSAADSDHIVGELMKGFLKLRPINEAKKEEMKKNCPDVDEAMLEKLQMGLPAISLPSLTALNSAFCNDVEAEYIYAQAVLALGKEKDVLVAISTSGNSKNVCAAAKAAKALGVTTIALTGKSGGKLKDICDLSICVPETETYKVQELHLPTYHCICAEIEEYFF